MSIYSEAFEGSLMPSGWTNTDAGDAAASVTGHTGNCAKLTNPMSYGGFKYSSFTVTQSIVADFWFKTDQFMYFGSLYPISYIFQLSNGSTPLISIVPQTGGLLDLFQYSGSGGTLVTSGSTFLSSNTWYNIRLEVELTNGGAATLKIDGATDISAATGTWDNGTAGANSLSLGSAPFTENFYDEIDIAALGGSSGSALTLNRRNPGGFKRLGL